MPPVGSLYGLAICLDSGLAGQDTIAFNAGTHHEVLHMPMAEYRRLVSPQVISLAREPAMDRGW